MVNNTFVLNDELNISTHLVSMQLVSKSVHNTSMLHHFHKGQVKSAGFGSQLQKHLLVARVFSHSLIFFFKCQATNPSKVAHGRITDLKKKENKSNKLVTIWALALPAFKSLNFVHAWNKNIHLVSSLWSVFLTFLSLTLSPRPPSGILTTTCHLY